MVGWARTAYRVSERRACRALVIERTGVRYRPRKESTVVTAPNQRWAMDFMHDTLAGGGSIRVFTLVDVCTRECVALHVAKRFRGEDVARLLTAASDARGQMPHVIQCDCGTEFTSVALDHWAYWNKVQLDFSRPGKPVDNCVCEAFNGSLRRECLSQHWFASLAEAATVLETWRQDYNDHRPHPTLGLQPPTASRRAGIFEPRSVRVINERMRVDEKWGDRPRAPTVKFHLEGMAGGPSQTYRVTARRES